MSHLNILQAAGFTAAELSGGTLAVHSPVDGSEIARLQTHSIDDVQSMIGKGVEAFKSWRNTRWSVARFTRRVWAKYRR